MVSSSRAPKTQDGRNSGARFGRLWIDRAGPRGTDLGLTIVVPAVNLDGAGGCGACAGC